ncbi:uncharacterized protein LOC114295518 [Camellia sinensis]|uniref:uncharacterized protein LOC114295518 n=1 Tax=Camellia sinensis TaxID=4442 RepID=UPI0010355107|nr:uncharacterized protein LOC114295518 [Camellia sinensis]XP_028095557.1 uncharacterized protein LOC114295518 [Camellia sinensis]XP_028095558.1 uncharacterized protein LOC114295518 [Camellia sinensis]
MGHPDQDIPSVPPEDMRSTEGLTPQEVEVTMLGNDVILFLEEREYATYRHTYLMPPLTGVRPPTRRAAGASSSSQVRVADTLSTSKAGTSRGGAGQIPPTYQHAGCPDIPIELTGWRYGTSYPIPLEPPLSDHRYVRDPNSPPPPSEYMDGLLEVVASLEGMVLQREMLLFVAGVQVPLLQAGPFRPSRGTGRGSSTRSRGRRRALIRDDEKPSEEKESAHLQSETFVGREEDSGSGSESGGDAGVDPEDGSSDSDGGAGGGGAEATQVKRMKRASRS